MNAPNNRLQLDSARAVHLCACSQARIVAHKWPAHALRLKRALMYKTNVRFLYKRRPLVILIDTFTSVRFGHSLSVRWFDLVQLNQLLQDDRQLLLQSAKSGSFYYSKISGDSGIKLSDRPAGRSFEFHRHFDDPSGRLTLQGVLETTITAIIGTVVGSSGNDECCLLYTSPSPRDKRQSRMPSSA